MEGLIGSYRLLQEMAPIIRSLDYGSFGSVWAMLLEEWAKHNHQDAVEVADQLVELIHSVNADLGPY